MFQEHALSVTVQVHALVSYIVVTGLIFITLSFP